MSSTPPQVINWMYSGNCNMKCEFCYGRFNKDNLTASQKHYIVDKIADAGIPKLTITGGEPLMGAGIYDIINYSKQKDICVSLHTNGLLLNENGLDKLERKVGGISLALDGSTNEINYAMRGTEGYFDIVTNLMKQIKERQIPIPNAIFALKVPDSKVSQ